MSKGAEGERFLVALAELKTTVADDPAQLDATWKDSPRLQNLCDEIAGLVRAFEAVEDASWFAFTNNVSAASAYARRDYDGRWRKTVSGIANRELAIRLLRGHAHGDSNDDDLWKFRVAGHRCSGGRPE